MRRTPFRLIAAVSAIVTVCAAAGRLHAARRPHYGGELRIHLRAALASLDPSETPQDALALAAQRQLLPAVFETMVRLVDRGAPQPLVAESRTHDVALKSLIFTVRPDVNVHYSTYW